MTLQETIRKQILDATKLKMEDRKSILKVILGEMDLQASRNGKPLTDDDGYRIIRKILQGVEEMLTYKPNDSKLETEKTILQSFLPQEISIHDLKISLTAKMEEIKSAKSDGQATGIAMKFFKENKISVDGNIVKKVVLEIRG